MKDTLCDRRILPVIILYLEQKENHHEDKKLAVGTGWQSSFEYACNLGGFLLIPVPTGVGTKTTSLPYAISTPGFYYLTGNLTTAGNAAITVTAERDLSRIPNDT